MNARGVRQRTSQKVCSDFLNFINDVLDRRGTGGAVAAAKFKACIGGRLHVFFVYYVLQDPYSED